MESSSSSSDTTSASTSTSSTNNNNNVIDMLVYEIGPYFICFQCMYWICHLIIVPKIWKWNIQHDQWTIGEQTFWAASIVSFIHAIIITIGSGHCLWTDGFLVHHHDTVNVNNVNNVNNDDLNFLLYTTTYSTCLNSIFVGYILSDLLLLVRHFHEWGTSNSIAFLIHHSIAFWAYIDMNTNNFAHFLALLTLLFEGTTPFVNIRWLLHKTNRQHTKWYLWNGYILTLLWLLLRIGVGGYVGYLLYSIYPTIIQILPWYSAYGSIGFTYIVAYLLQWFWFYKILKGAMKLLLANKKKKEKKKTN